MHPAAVGLASRVVDDDAELVDRLRAGDESAFVALIERYQPRMLRLAEATVGSRAVAEEVTQDTWLAVIRGVERFEGRSTRERSADSLSVEEHPYLAAGVRVHAAGL